MVSELDAWSQRCEGVLADLEAEMERVRTEAGKSSVRRAEVKEQISRANDMYGKGVDDEPGRRPARGKLGGNSFDDDAMDLDGGFASRSLRGRTQGLSGFGRKR